MCYCVITSTYSYVKTMHVSRVVVVLTLTRPYNAVRGQRTDSTLLVDSMGYCIKQAHARPSEKHTLATTELFRGFGTLIPPRPDPSRGLEPSKLNLDTSVGHSFLRQGLMNGYDAFKPINSVMARGARFLLGFRLYPFLRKAGPGIPFFGISVLLVDRVFARKTLRSFLLVRTFCTRVWFGAAVSCACTSCTSKYIFIF